MKNNYPDLVVKLVNSCSGWIFGSACVKDNPRDYDVFVPLPFWHKASMLIPKNAKINRMGGFKCLSEEIEVDVWTGEMYDLMASEFFAYAYHPVSNILIKKIAPQDKAEASEQRAPSVPSNYRNCTDCRESNCITRGAVIGCAPRSSTYI